jgi:hypothetical protein
VFFPVFWTIYIPIVTIMLGAAGERLIHALRQLPRASAACLFEPAASAVLRSMIVARWRRCANHLPPVNGISQRPCRKFSQSSSNFAQASAVDAAYVSFGAGGSEPLTIDARR